MVGFWGGRHCSHQKSRNKSRKRKYAFKAPIRLDPNLHLIRRRPKRIEHLIESTYQLLINLLVGSSHAAQTGGVSGQRTSPEWGRFINKEHGTIWSQCRGHHNKACISALYFSGSDRIDEKHARIRLTKAIIHPVCYCKLKPPTAASRVVGPLTTARPYSPSISVLPSPPSFSIIEQ